MNAVEVKELTKKYYYLEKKGGFKESIKSLFKSTKKEKIAVKDVSFSIKHGEIVGLIGPNGAGKTTIIKSLTGIIKPSQGEIRVLGYEPSKLQDEFKKKYAVVMGQKSQLWWDLPAIDTFYLNKELYEISDEIFEKNLEYFVELFDVKDILHVQVRQLSLGERMKMEVIACLMHNPQIVFLDEPTIGLDAIAQKQMRRFLKKVNQEKGITIILTSHYMQDIEDLCNRIIIINKGTCMYEGNLENLLTKYREFKILTVTFNESVQDGFENDYKKDIEWIEKTLDKIKIKVKNNHEKEIIKWLMDKYSVKDISIEQEEIGDLIEKIYKQEQVK